MAIITTTKLHANTPAVEMDWTGNPMKPGDAYGGRPEHLSDKEKMKIVRSAKRAPDPTTIERLRAAMAHARAVRSARVKERKLKELSKKAQA